MYWRSQECADFVAMVDTRVSDAGWVVSRRAQSVLHLTNIHSTMHQGLGFGVTAKILNFEGALAFTLYLVTLFLLGSLLRFCGFCVFTKVSVLQ
jgi:hypothetical protein